MKRKLLHSLPPLLGLLLFSTALWVLYHELQAYHLADIVHDLRNVPTRHLTMAILLTATSYLIMTGYDALALRYLRRSLSYTKIALASFISYAFSNNIGLSMLAGGSVRYFLYSSWGLSPLEISKLILFCTLTLWLGFFTLGGLVFVFEPLTVPADLHLPFDSLHILGVVLLTIVFVYTLLCLFRNKRPFSGERWGNMLPGFSLLIPQMVLSLLDWILAGAVLYVLLPDFSPFTFQTFLGIFLLAQLAGMASQVPGGIGVFETVAVLLLTPALPAPEVVGSLLIYRGIYYLLPLVVAAVMLGAKGAFQYRERIRKTARLFDRWVWWMVPQVMALTIFLGGMTLLLSGAAPSETGRLALLEDIFPLPVAEVSHFLASLTGAGLLFLARGLQRRLDAAYIMTILLLGAGIVFSMFKGLEYEESLTLTIMLLAILPCRRFFYRKASLISQRFTLPWITAIILVLLSAFWLGMFSYKHVEYSSALWWRFAFNGDAPRFLRAMVGAAVLILFMAAARLFRPSQPKNSPAEPIELDKAAIIVRNSTRSTASLALLGDKAFIFSPENDAFIMYRLQGKSWVALGDPVGPVQEWSDLIWQFMEMCDSYGGQPVFYAVGRENLHIYLDLGLSLIRLGEEARVPLADFSLDGSTRKGLRYTKRRHENEGYVFEIVKVENAEAIMPVLRQISDAWLTEKHTREKGFSLGFFNERYLSCFPIAIVRKDEKIIAFANIWPGSDREELSIDLMRHLPEAPNGVMDYLFIQIMLWGKQEGYRWFNLGMAPLAGFENRALSPLWNRLGAFVFQHGEHFYNFQGLRRYKEKFEPQWESRYLASRGGRNLPKILVDIASLISGGISGIVMK